MIKAGSSGGELQTSARPDAARPLRSAPSFPSQPERRSASGSRRTAPCDHVQLSPAPGQRADPSRRRTALEELDAVRAHHLRLAGRLQGLESAHEHLFRQALERCERTGRPVSGGAVTAEASGGDAGGRTMKVICVDQP